jgi:hypothetical protein
MSSKILKLINILSYFTRAFAFYLVYINSTFDFNGAIHYNLEMPFITSVIVAVIFLDYIGFKYYKNRKLNKVENDYVLRNGFLGKQ